MPEGLGVPTWEACAIPPLGVGSREPWPSEGLGGSRGQAARTQVMRVVPFLPWLWLPGFLQSLCLPWPSQPSGPSERPAAPAKSIIPSCLLPEGGFCPCFY